MDRAMNQSKALIFWGCWGLCGLLQGVLLVHGQPNIEPTSPDMAPMMAPLVIDRVQSAATRGSPQRTVSRFQFGPVTAQDSFVSDLESVKAELSSSDFRDPRLVIDARGFVGGVVTRLAFSPDGRWLAAAGDVVRIWDVKSGELLHTLRGQLEEGSSGSSTDLAFTPDGKQLLVSVSGYGDGLRVYNTENPAEISEVYAPHFSHVERFALSQDGRYLVTTSADNELWVWDWPRKKSLWKFRTNEPVDHLSFVDRQPLVVLVNTKGTVAYFSCLNGRNLEFAQRQPLERLLFPQRAPAGASVHPFALDIDLQRGRLLQGSLLRNGNRYEYWCTFFGNRTTHYKHKYFVTACALSPNQQVAASADALGNIHLWNTDNGQNLHTFSSIIRSIYSVQWDESGRKIRFGRKPYQPPAWQFNHYALLTHEFDLARRTVSEPTAQEPPPAPLEQNGRTLRVTKQGDYFEAQVLRQGRLESRLPFRSSTKSMPLCYAFLQGAAAGVEDGVVIGGEGGIIGMYDPRNMQNRCSLAGHAGRVWCLHQSTDPRFLVSGSADGTIRFWRVGPGSNRGNVAAYTESNGKVFHVVPNTPTASAGLREGDVIFELGDWNLGDLANHFARTGKWPFRAGEKVTVAWQRGQQTMRREIELSTSGNVIHPLLNLFVTEDGGDWILWTPQGYYDASPNGDRLIGWHLNHGRASAARFYPAAQFRQQLYRPDVIDRLLDVGDFEQALKLANAERGNKATHITFQSNTGLNSFAGASVNQEPNTTGGESITTLQPPQVTIMEPGTAISLETQEVTVRADVVSPSGKPLLDVKVLVNGRSQAFRDIVRVKSPTATAEEAQKESETHWVVSRTVKLQPGHNEISVIASTTHATCLPQTANVYCRAPPEANDQPQLYVLSVGISKYQNAAYNLQFADHDAEEFAKAWKSQTGGLYSKMQSKVLTNEQATAANVRGMFDWVAPQVRPQDVVVVFMAGHGVMDDQQNYYLATHEVHLDRLRSTSVRWSDLYEFVVDLECKVLLFVDTCHGGAATGKQNVVFDPLRDLAREDVGGHFVCRLFTSISQHGTP